MRNPFTVWDKAILAGAGLVGVAAFLPWFSAFGVSAYGVSGDGKLTAFVAAAGLAVMLGVRWRRSWVYGLEAVLAVLAGLVGLSYAGDEFSAIGVYLTVLGGIIWLAASAVEAFRPGPANPNPRAGSEPPHRGGIPPGQA